MAPEEEEAEIMQPIVSIHLDGDDVHDHEEDVVNDETVKETISSSAELKLYVYHLQIGLKQKRFDKMNQSKNLIAMFVSFYTTNNQ